MFAEAVLSSLISRVPYAHDEAMVLGDSEIRTGYAWVDALIAKTLARVAR